MTENQNEAAFILEDVCRVYVHKADITKLKVSAIVNAANKKLKHGSGVARAIADAGGKKFNDDCRRLIKEEGYLKMASVVKTVAGDLPCSWVFHTVGPNWPFTNHKKLQEYRRRLSFVFWNALEFAELGKFGSIALPPISAGKHGMPANDVAVAMVDAIKLIALANRLINLLDIHLVDIKDDVLPLVIALMDQSGHHDAEGVSVKRIHDPVERPASDDSYYAAFMVKDLIKVHIYRKDITKVSVDVIVNAVSNDLNLEGSLATAIAQAVGTELKDKLKKNYMDNGKLKEGQIVETKAGGLPCKTVYHTVGPKWLSDTDREKLDECQDYLTSAFKNSISYTDKDMHGSCESIAVPPISSGKFGVPNLNVARSMVDAIKSIALMERKPAEHSEIHVVDVNDDILGLVISLLDLGTYMDVKTGQRISVKRTPSKRAFSSDSDDEPPTKKKR